jgi:predicted dienelactone hydrolase
VTKSGSDEPMKLVPIIFTHGIGNTMSTFSTILKDLATQGHVVFSLEHNDRTALHINQNEEDKYFKQVDMRDYNTIIAKLG